MGSNWADYCLPSSKVSDLECCIEEFWYSLEEDIYDKEFLETLMRMANDVQTGKVETVPFDIEDFIMYEQED